MFCLSESDLLLPIPFYTTIVFSCNIKREKDMDELYNMDEEKIKDIHI